MKTNVASVLTVIIALATVAAPQLVGAPASEGEQPLHGYRIAALIDDGFHPEETPQPIAHWESLGAEVILVGTRTGTAKAAFGPLRLEMETTVDALSLDAIDAIFIPGGTSPAKLKDDAAVLEFVRQADAAGKLITAICHGPQVLIEAGILEGRVATCVTVEARDYFAVRDALIAAGATYVDTPVVTDGNLVTARRPEDVPPFKAAVAEALGKRERR